MEDNVGRQEHPPAPKKKQCAKEEEDGCIPRRNNGGARPHLHYWLQRAPVVTPTTKNHQTKLVVNEAAAP